MSVMNRIVMHHTGGARQANSTDKKHYHGITEWDGTHVLGHFKITDNKPGRLVSGKYAAHTRNLNSGAIGEAMACMGGKKTTWADPYASPFYPFPNQVQAFIKTVASRCIEYAIPVTRKTVLTHAEVEITLGVKQANKWDFDYLFFDIDEEEERKYRTRQRDPVYIGDMLRERISDQINHLERLQSTVTKQPEPFASTLPTLRRGSIGDSVVFLQKMLNLKTDGMFGPATYTAVVAFQKKNNLLPDGIVGKMTWMALGQ